MAVVWLGNDDNKATGLSGASGALPVWIDLMSRLKPTSLQAAQPDNVQWQWVDKMSGKLSAEGCDGAMYVPYLTSSIPVDQVPCVAEKELLNDPINAVVNGAVNKVLDIFR